MSYIKAELILPQELLEIIQEYAQGQYLYIPKKAENHKEWGTNTNAKKHLCRRDEEIYHKYMQGASAMSLADEYFLSPKSIQRILLKEKKRTSVMS